ncbi:MAG: hypothetical protein Q4C95_08110 [Planctomycetia bacterium]|nr:hypothetical protein [Planctomycetia bacterium]
MSELSIIKFIKDAPESTSNSNETESSKKNSIHLKKQQGQWFVSDYFDFPAENSEQMAKVISPLLDLTVLGVALDSDALAQSYNESATKAENFYRAAKLLDPEKATQSEASFTGTSLKISGQNNEVFVQLIIGDQAEESSAVRDIRYVRIPDGTVYLVDFSTASRENSNSNQSFPEALSVDPLDWINRDFLQISRWNIKQLRVHNYKLEPTDQQNSNPLTANLPKFNDKTFISTGYFRFDQDPTNSLDRVWTLNQHLKMNDSGKYEPIDISNSEMANSTKINKIVDLLGHLNLVNIQRKSDFMANVFRENRSFREIVQRNESLESLGFYLADYDLFRPNDSAPEPNWLGEAGDLELLMNDGSKIHLYFGKLQKNQRIVLVTANFDSNDLVAPTLLPLQKMSADLSPEAKSKIEADNKAIESENSLRKSEHLLNITEGRKKAQEKRVRWSNWFYFIDESDFQKLKVQSSDLIKTNQ